MLTARFVTVNAIVLLTNGISFALQAVVLLTIGAWADYGQWRCVAAIVHDHVKVLIHLFYRPNITIFFTLLAVGVSFAWLGVEDPAHWRAGVALYILGREFPRSS